MESLFGKSKRKSKMFSSSNRALPKSIRALNNRMSKRTSYVLSSSRPMFRGAKNNLASLSFEKRLAVTNKKLGFSTPSVIKSDPVESKSVLKSGSVSQRSDGRPVVVNVNVGNRARNQSNRAMGKSSSAVNKLGRLVREQVKKKPVYKNKFVKGADGAIYRVENVRPHQRLVMVKDAQGNKVDGAVNSKSKNSVGNVRGKNKFIERYKQMAIKGKDLKFKNEAEELAYRDWVSNLSDDEINNILDSYAAEERRKEDSANRYREKDREMNKKGYFRNPKTNRYSKSKIWEAVRKQRDELEVAEAAKKKGLVYDKKNKIWVLPSKTEGGS